MKLDAKFITLPDKLSLSPDPCYSNSIEGLLAKGGELLVYTNIQNDNENYGGPPWPLYRRELLGFEKYGLKVQGQNEKMINKPVAPYDAVVQYKKSV